MVMQHPITDFMTPEELKQYRQEVYEAHYANKIGKIDLDDAWRGRSYCITPKTMSDDLTYPHIKQPAQGTNTMTHSINEKAELIDKCKSSIEKLNQQILKIQSDSTLTDDERKKKIARRMDIIDGYTLSIQQAEEYIKRETLRTRQIYEHQMNKLK